MVKSPLRYPGGKSKALDKIISQRPAIVSEYREPFVGGGSICLGLKDLLGDQVKSFWINDLNFDLHCFWLWVKTDLDRLVDQIKVIKQSYVNGRDLYQYLTRVDLTLSEFDRAVRFFVLNRITFSGTVESGGYSPQAFEHRFTDSSIERLQQLSGQLSLMKITNLDYESLLTKEGEDVFIFLDPPYFRTTKSKLYGVTGNLHITFDHDRFAENMKKCPHKWLITYDDSPKIRSLFEFADITPWSLQYSMNNYKQKTAAIGRELLIKNF